MTPFTINVSTDQLDDLRYRLANTRWPDEINDSYWEYGTNLDYLKQLCGYWHTGFDWAAQENALNRFSQYQTEIDDLGVHFIYQKGNGTKNLPLLLIHGWPDSFYRFYKIITALTEPNENGVAYDVIVPSIPGFGFSAQPKIKGFGPAKVASLFHQLMSVTLGYNRYFVHGGDWGASIATHMSIQKPGSIERLHLTNVPPELFNTFNTAEFNEEEKAYLANAGKWRQKEGAYVAIQSSKPQTLAYGLNDSPSGLAAWIIEKFYSWTDHQKDMENKLTKDELLTNLSIYWFTQTAGSAARIYYEAMRQLPSGDPVKIDVPAYFSIFPADPTQIPESFGRRIYNVQSWAKKAKGGHFPALEIPEILIEDIRAAFDL